MRMGIERHSNKTSLPLEQKFPLKKIKNEYYPSSQSQGWGHKPLYPR